MMIGYKSSFNYRNKKMIIFIIAILISSNLFVLSKPAKASNSLEGYIQYFYNRYSKHLDKWGLVYKAPGYGVGNFKRAKSAREILSLATYYKYRALQGEIKARRKLRAAILNARYELNSRNQHSHSFSDAWAQMAIISLTQQLPHILTNGEKETIYQEIKSRILSGIQATDSSNRSLLSAVYWQYIVNQLHVDNYFSQLDKNKYDHLIYQKVAKVIDQDITQDGWYRESYLMRFNPHYHMVSATALLSYADITNNIPIYLLAKKMTRNLRLVSFKNGMVEAQVGDRPVGLGAQFYLGAALLSYRFGYQDFSTYLNYAKGDRFFSDPKYPNRLEYHATLQGVAPNYHDDISFSNLAELALITPTLSNMEFNYTTQLDLKNTQYISKKIKVINQSHTIQFNDQQVRLLKGGDNTDIRKIDFYDADLISADSLNYNYNLQNTYYAKKLDLATENKYIQDFRQRLDSWSNALSQSAFKALAAAYIYGNYSLAEIVDTIKNGPGSVHPTIPASVWRGR